MNRSTAIAPWSQIDAEPGLGVAVISLRDEVGRRHLLKERGVPESWVDEFWVAEDLRRTPASNLGAYCDVGAIEARIRRAVSAAEVGCAVSHLAVSRWLARSRHDLMLVLEDDVIPLVPSFLDQVSAIGRMLAPRARAGAAFICHLGIPSLQLSGVVARRVFSRSGAGNDMTTLMLLSDPASDVWRTHAYLVSRGAAERTERLERVARTLADDWGERRRLGLIDEIFYAHPALIGQDEAARSTIGSARESAILKGGLGSTDLRKMKGRRLFDVFGVKRVARSFQVRTGRLRARLESRLPYIIE